MSMVGKLTAFLRSLFVHRRRAMRKLERLKRMIYMVDATADTEIACEEAYRLVDQYADLVLRGEDAAEVMPQMKHHLEMCVDCREELEALLEALRATTE